MRRSRRIPRSRRMRLPFPTRSWRPPNRRPPRTCPYQWVLRRLYLTRFTDSDAIVYPDGGEFKLVELAPNVQHVQGGTANNLIVAMKDFLIVFDAPYGELQSRWTIDAAKAKYPGKPIKYLVLTHHHMDHTGGMRTYVAEGATIVVPSEALEYFEKVVRAPHTVVLGRTAKEPADPGDLRRLRKHDDQGRNRRYPSLQSFGAGECNGRRGSAIRMSTACSSAMWSTASSSMSPTSSRRAAPWRVRRPRLRSATRLREFDVEETDLTFVGGHGTTVKQADIAAALAAN